MGGTGTANQADWWCDGTLGSRAMVQQELKQTAGEKTAWSRRGQASAQVGCATFPLGNETKIAQSHHSSDILRQSTACPATLRCCIRDNSLSLLLRFLRQLKWKLWVQLSLGTAPVPQGCCLTVVFYCFFQKVPAEKISIKKHSVKMQPVVLN